MGNHWKDLLVWQKSHALVKLVYLRLKELPDNEKYNLIDQIKRAAVSIPTNIVEGQAKPTGKDFLRYLYISRGSLEELRYLSLLSNELGYIPESTFRTIEDQCTEVSFLLNRLILSLHKTP